MAKQRVLIIDDDARITEFLHRGLTYEGYSVSVANNGTAGLDAARQHKPDVVILDVMMPGMDGMEVCRRLKASGNAPILMLTAKDAISDKVRGLETGADDYLVKPFAFEELLARIHALLRRHEQPALESLRYADLVLDTGSRWAFRGQRKVSLSTTEYKLLLLFMRHPGQVLTRNQIIDHVWGDDFSGESNVLEVYIRNVRSKLEQEDEPRLIHTMRGTGYVLRE